VRALALALLLAPALAAGCDTRVVDLAVPLEAGASPGNGGAAGNGGSGGNGGTASGGAPGRTDAAPEAAEPIKCDDVTRSDGSVCKLCYGPDGSVRSSTCAPAASTDAATMTPVPPVKPPDPGNGAPDGGAVAPAMCRVIPDKQPRCLSCERSGMGYTVCLVCQPAVPTGLGDSCQVCSWSDQPNTRCLQCFEPMSNKATHDDCDGLRPESVPPGNP
jgi:hypothetical protein